LNLKKIYRSDMLLNSTYISYTVRKQIIFQIHSK
jgi:hypothetical protein